MFSVIRDNTVGIFQLVILLILSNNWMQSALGIVPLEPLNFVLYHKLVIFWQITKKQYSWAVNLRF